MDKNNSSVISAEKLLYIDPPKLKETSSQDRQNQLYPELSNKSKKINELGMFRAVVIPSLKENPLVPLGASLAVVTLGYSMYCMARGQKDKASKYMNIQYGFQVLTVAAVMGGYTYRKYKHRKTEESGQVPATATGNLKE